MKKIEYKGYKIFEEKNEVLVEGVRDFDPVHIFECGQCFRWVKDDKGGYRGVVRDKAVRVSFEGDTLKISNSGIEDFKALWYGYFDLGRDYGKIKEKLAVDHIMSQAVRFGSGIRLLKQDISETLISFIISANNMIPRIMKTVETICSIYGEEIDLEGHIYHTFPDIGKLADTNLEELGVCRGGFRCKYIINSAAMVKGREVVLESLTGKTVREAKQELMKLPGVGPKVADCVLLFSGTHYDVFPTDVWVKRVMEELYFKREASFKEIDRFADEKFGNLKGFAQQYLFYYARENRIGVKSSRDKQ